MTRYGPWFGSGGGSARITVAWRATLRRLKGPSTWPVRSMSATRLPNRSGSASAASTTASAFSSVRRVMPAALAALAAVRPFEASGKLPEAFPSARPPSRCRSLAASRSSGSRARLMATASERVKSFRQAFSANSPFATDARSTTLTAISVHPSRLQMAIRRAPAMRTPSGRITMGCSRPSRGCLLRARTDRPYPGGAGCQ